MFAWEPPQGMRSPAARGRRRSQWGCRGTEGRQAHVVGGNHGVAPAHAGAGAHVIVRDNGVKTDTTRSMLLETGGTGPRLQPSSQDAPSLAQTAQKWTKFAPSHPRNHPKSANLAPSWSNPPRGWRSSPAACPGQDLSSPGRGSYFDRRELQPAPQCIAKAQSRT